MVLAADDEDELAAMLSHGIAHVTPRHPFGQDEKASSLGSRVSIAALAKASALGVPIEFLQFTVPDEQEADRMGLQNLMDAGYDGRALLKVFGKLQAARSTVPILFETHVPSPERVRRIEPTITSIPQPTSTNTDRLAEFQRIKRRLEEVVSRKTL